MVAAIRNWQLWQLNFKNAFLHGDLLEAVYIDPPRGYASPSSHVCRLRKSLYDLKQSRCAWFDKFRGVILATGFYQSPNDHSLFVRHNRKGCTLLLLYVNDMSNDVLGIIALESYLIHHFKMKDLGHSLILLRLEISCTLSGIDINQKKYVEDLLSLAHLTDSKIYDTLMGLTSKLHRDKGNPLSDPTLYKKLVWSLIYLTMTSLDISYAVHIVSQFVGNPYNPHLTVVHRILQYIRETLDKGLFYSSTSHFVLHAYSDADWVGCPNTKRSTTSWCMFLRSSLIS